MNCQVLVLFVLVGSLSMVPTTALDVGTISTVVEAVGQFQGVVRRETGGYARITNNSCCIVKVCQGKAGCAVIGPYDSWTTPKIEGGGREHEITATCKQEGINDNEPLLVAQDWVVVNPFDVTDKVLSGPAYDSCHCDGRYSFVDSDRRSRPTCS